MTETIDVDELIGPVEPGSLRAILATTLNGSAATPEGTSGGLGNRTDTELLLRVREVVDVILVSAGTVRTEDYGPVHADTRIAAVTRSLDLDTSTRFFTDAEPGPIILTPQECLDDPALAGRRRALADAGAQLLSSGDGSPAAMLDALRSLGLANVSLEGGPSLYEAFLDAGLIDVWHLTVDPSIVSPVTTPFIAGTGSTVTRHRLTLEHLAATDDGCLFLRYRRA